MVSAERSAGKPLVPEGSLALLAQAMAIEKSLSRQAAKPGGLDAIMALYARGYWRTRYLEERWPGQLKVVLAQPRAANWDDAIAAPCQVDGASFWLTVDVALVPYFKGK